jgi:hypothetical protein
MRWRRKRTAPSVTELSRVEQVLERDAGLRRLLGPKTCPVRKRSGEPVYFTAETVAVTRALMARNLSAERSPVLKVVSVAAEVLEIGGEPSSAPGR